jgi:transposase
MRFAGIDIASQTHVVAVVDAEGNVIVRATPFGEDVEGYARLRELLGTPTEVVVAFEATGHYWQNLAAALAADGFGLVLLNPIRTRRYAESDMARAKTDAIDALGIARFASEKRLEPKYVPDVATDELRELVRLRDRLQQDLGDRVRQLHRAVDLAFPELTGFLRDLSSRKATTILARYPTARAMARARESELAALVYDGRRKLGKDLARKLMHAAGRSVGAHQGTPYELQTKFYCQDIDLFRQRLAQLDDDISGLLEQHEIGKLLVTIDGIGVNTAARLIAEFGDPSQFGSAAGLAAYVGVAPHPNHSGKRRPRSAPTGYLSDASLRAKLWMPTLTAVRKNAWLRHFYERLRAAGKPGKVALVASMRKLLTAVYSVAKNRTPFVPHVPERQLTELTSEAPC